MPPTRIGTAPRAATSAICEWAGLGVGRPRPRAPPNDVSADDGRRQTDPHKDTGAAAYRVPSALAKVQDAEVVRDGGVDAPDEVVWDAPSFVVGGLVGDPVQSLVDLQRVDADDLGGSSVRCQSLGQLQRQQ